MQGESKQESKWYDKEGTDKRGDCLIFRLSLSLHTLPFAGSYGGECVGACVCVCVNANSTTVHDSRKGKERKMKRLVAECDARGAVRGDSCDKWKAKGEREAGIE